MKQEYDPLLDPVGLLYHARINKLRVFDGLTQTEMKEETHQRILDSGPAIGETREEYNDRVELSRKSVVRSRRIDVAAEIESMREEKASLN